MQTQQRLLTQHTTQTQYTETELHYSSKLKFERKSIVSFFIVKVDEVCHEIKKLNKKVNQLVDDEASSPNKTVRAFRNENNANNHHVSKSNLEILHKDVRLNLRDNKHISFMQSISLTIKPIVTSSARYS